MRNLGRNLYSMHSFLHTILLTFVPNASALLGLPKIDVGLIELPGVPGGRVGFLLIPGETRQ